MSALGIRSGSDRPWVWAPVAVLAAAILGLAWAVDVRAGVAALTVAVGAVACFAWPRPLLVLLFASVYAPFLIVAGLPVGRLVAPVALLACVPALVTARYRARGLPTSIPTAATLLVVIAVASIGWSADLGSTVEKLGSLTMAVVYLAAVSVLVSTERDLRDVLLTVTVAATVLGSVWIWSLTQGISRFESVAGDPNFFAMQQAMALPLTIAFAPHVRSPFGRVATYGAAGVILVSILASLSRGGLVTLAILIVLLAVVPGPALFGSSARKRKVLMSTLVILAISIPWVGPGFEQRLAEPASSDASFVGDDPRLGLARAALHAWGDAPLTGIGFGMFLPTSYEYLRTTPGVDLGRFPTEALVAGREVHDAYLEVLVELGPLGLAAFVFLLVSGLVTCRRVWRASPVGIERSAAIAIALGLVTFAVASVALSTTTTRSLWAWLGLAVALARSVDPMESIVPGRPVARPTHARTG